MTSAKFSIKFLNFLFSCMENPFLLFLWYSVGSQIGTSKLIDCRWPAASFTSSRDQSTIAVINRYNHLESNQISYWSSILRLKDFLHTGTRPLRDLSSPLSWFIHRQQFWLWKQNSFIFILSLFNLLLFLFPLLPFFFHPHHFFIFYQVVSFPFTLFTFSAFLKAENYFSFTGNFPIQWKNQIPINEMFNILNSIGNLIFLCWQFQLLQVLKAKNYFQSS